MRRCRRVLALAVFLLAFAAAPSWAAALQPQPPEPPAGFVPSSSLPSQQEKLPAAPLVLTAYAVAWVAVFGYLWSIWRRLGRVERELADVSRRIEAGGRR
jgi:CcmD family protein